MGEGGFKLPWMTYEELRKRADAFRSKHQVASMACPIELIVERLGLDIVPVRDLYRNFDISAYLTADMSAINVDMYCTECREATYRFALAHEMAHLELHSELWHQLSFQSVTEWPTAVCTLLTGEEYKGVEWQAEAFAGLVLVPQDHLRTVFEGQVEDIVERAKAYSGVSPQICFDICFKVLCERVADQFVVDPIVVGVRCDYDKLSDEFAARLFGDEHGLETTHRHVRR